MLSICRQDPITYTCDRVKKKRFMRKMYNIINVIGILSFI